MRKLFLVLLILLLVGCGKKTNTINNVKFDENGLITWNNVSDARGYNVYLNESLYYSPVNQLKLDLSTYAGIYVTYYIEAILDNSIIKSKTYTKYIDGGDLEKKVIAELKTILDSKSVDNILASARKNGVGPGLINQTINALRNINDSNKFINELIKLNLNSIDYFDFLIDTTNIILDSNLSGVIKLPKEKLKDYLATNREDIKASLYIGYQIYATLGKGEIINFILRGTDELSVLEMKEIRDNIMYLFNHLDLCDEKIILFSTTLEGFLCEFYGDEFINIGDYLSQILINIRCLFSNILGEFDYLFSMDNSDNYYNAVKFIQYLINKDSVDQRLMSISDLAIQVLNNELWSSLLIKNIYQYFSKIELKIVDLIDFKCLLFATLSGNYKVFKKALNQVLDLDLFKDGIYLNKLIKVSSYDDFTKILPGIKLIFDASFNTFSKEDYGLMVNFYENIINAMMDVYLEELASINLVKANDFTSLLIKALDDYYLENEIKDVHISTLVELGYLDFDLDLDLLIRPVKSLFKLKYEINSFQAYDYLISFDSDKGLFNYQRLENEKDYHERISQNKEKIVELLFKSAPEISKLLVFDYSQIDKENYYESYVNILLIRFKNEFIYYEETNKLIQSILQ